MNPPHRTTRSSPTRKPGLGKPVQGGLAAAVLLLIPLLAIGGGDRFRAALDFTTGVLSLVSLTASVAWGLLATDRLLLSVRHRLLAQAVHRTTAVASLGFLLLHATVKVSLGHVELIGALIPFSLGLTGTSGLIGLGSLAGLLMVVAASTGAARSALAGRGPIAARWRPLHMLAYPAWCFALMHGLYAGRPAAAWVTTMYCLALTGVAGAVSVRLLPRPTQNKLAERLLALLGPGAERNASPSRRRRDLSVSPLPGTADLPTAATGTGRAGPAPYPPEPSRPPTAPEWTAERPATSPEWSAERAGTSPEWTAERPPVSPDWTAGRPAGDPPGRARKRRSSSISAGYRAVSLGTTGGTAAAASGGPATQEIPFAERVPMTEELPVVAEEPATRPGYWPTPSPPPPAQSPAPPSSYIPQQPTRSPFDSFGSDAPGSGSGSSGRPGGDPFEGGFAPSPPSTTPPSYAFPYGYGDRGATGGHPATGPDTDVRTDVETGAGTGQAPFSPFTPFADPAQGTFQQPPAGEPWTAPAGERP
ncbi:ferric reductase-like transmembrane domain-containing protein [Streptomyces sp. NPDC047097]|uniref:ferric reductase-like transmembrane domain-containing protein n=1 Tax=Streptomyces sp. NPDC047097 TaxID=3155260 RepID=UPI0033CBD0FB